MKKINYLLKFKVENNEFIIVSRDVLYFFNTSEYTKYCIFLLLFLCHFLIFFFLLFPWRSWVSSLTHLLPHLAELRTNLGAGVLLRIVHFTCDAPTHAVYNPCQDGTLDFMLTHLAVLLVCTQLWNPRHYVPKWLGMLGDA